MGIEPTPNLKTKRLPSAGGTVWNASEATGTIIGRELDVSPEAAAWAIDGQNFSRLLSIVVLFSKLVF